MLFFVIMRYTYIYFAAASTPRVERVLQMNTDENRILYKCVDCLILVDFQISMSYMWYVETS